MTEQEQKRVDALERINKDMTVLLETSAKYLQAVCRNLGYNAFADVPAVNRVVQKAHAIVKESRDL